MECNNITINDFYNARKNIENFINRTPLLHSTSLSRRLLQDVHLKCEMLQPVGAFKIRGAAHKLISLSEEQKACGVVTVSTGNHGACVAYMAQKLNIQAHVFVSKNVPEKKLDNIRQYQPKLVVVGDSQDEAEVAARNFTQKKGATFIHPFDDLDIIKGQGTMAIELMEALPQVSTVLIPLSGGGMAAGVATALKQLKPDIHIVGVSMEKGAAMYESLKLGHPVAIKEVISLADSLQGGIGLENQHTFKLCQKYVDEVILVSESEIFKALKFMLYEHKFLLEGAAVVGVAALLSSKFNPLSGAVATILSGNNIDIQIIEQLVRDKQYADY